MLIHLNQIFNKFFVLGFTSLLILLVSLWRIRRKAKVFYFNKSILSNHFKKASINEDIYFLLRQLESEGHVHNTLLLEFFRQKKTNTLDCVIKKKNKMITTFMELQDHVFSTTLIKKIKDPNDLRQVIYVLNKYYTLKEIR